MKLPDNYLDFLTIGVNPDDKCTTLYINSEEGTWTIYPYDGYTDEWQMPVKDIQKYLDDGTLAVEFSAHPFSFDIPKLAGKITDLELFVVYNKLSNKADVYTMDFVETVRKCMAFYDKREFLENIADNWNDENIDYSGFWPYHLYAFAGALSLSIAQVEVFKNIEIYAADQSQYFSEKLYDFPLYLFIYDTIQENLQLFKKNTELLKSIKEYGKKRYKL